MGLVNGLIDEQMEDGWMDGQIDSTMRGWLGFRMDGRKHACMHAWMGRLMDEFMDRCIHAQMDACKD